MGRHEENITGNGKGELDLSKTKDVREAGGGQRSTEDRGDTNDEEGDDRK